MRIIERHGRRGMKKIKIKKEKTRKMKTSKKRRKQRKRRRQIVGRRIKIEEIKQ